MDKAYSPKLYWTNCLWLMGLLALTWCLGYVNSISSSPSAFPLRKRF